MKKRILKNEIRTFVVTLVFFIVPSLLFAQSNNSERKVRVGYYENEVFQEGAKIGNIKKGYAYEYYRKLSEYTGWEYEYEYGTFIELYKKLESGKIDLLAGLAYSEERAQSILYEDIPMGSTQYYLLKKNSSFGITANAATLNGKKIGVQNSIMIQILNNWLETNNVKANIVVFNDNNELFESFDKGNLDSIMIEGAGAYGRQDSDAFVCVGKTDYYLCVSKDRPDLLSVLNETHTKLLYDNPNFLNTLYNKYYSKSVSSRAFTLEEMQYLKTHDSLTIGYLNNYLPYCSSDSDGNLTGLLKDIVPAQLEKLGLTGSLKISYKVYEDFSQMISSLYKNEIDVAFPVGGGLYFSEEGGFYQSEPVVNTSVALVLKGEYKKDRIPSFAVNRNNDMQLYYIETNFPNSIITFYDFSEDCLEGIVKGEADFTTLNGLRVTPLLRNSKFKTLSYRLLTQSDERCFGVKIGNENLLRILNRGINSLGEQYILNQAYEYSDELFQYSILDYIKNIMYVLLPMIFIVGSFIFVHNVRTKKKLKTLNIKLEEALENKERFIADMIRYASSESDADKILNQLVEYIGINTDSDRVYVFEENENHRFNNTYEWCKNGVSKKIDSLQNIPFKGILEFGINKFKEDGNVTIRDVEKYKDINETIYKILKMQNIKTLAAIPLKIQGRIIGFVCAENSPASEILNVSEFLKMVDFFFSLMVRIRNGVAELERIALHDQLTGFYNRNAYEETIKDFNFSAWGENFVYVSIDINGLKVVNDTVGHEAGDELIVGACDCMKFAFDPYGKLYRTGGDEFIALICADENQLEQIKNNLQKACDAWHGKLIEKLSISCGYVSIKKENYLSLHEITVLADKRMYESKSEFYKKSGFDRRGQKDAHIALQSMYTKILKINIDEDSYQIINIDKKERTLEMGFAEKISDWFKNFGLSGQVHPDDLEEYLKKTDLKYISDFFNEDNKILRVFYKRKYDDGYKKVMMELVPVDDYGENNKNIFLYVKIIN